MDWRVAKSLLTLREQVNTMYPNRNKENDGTIGDANHSARTSDHNPDDNGVVCAMDITHDPASGCDSYALAEVFRAAKDKRIKYIISNRKICSSSVAPWQWRPYHGVNPHDHHVHVSVLDEPSLYDDTTPWDLTGVGTHATTPVPSDAPAGPAMPPTLRNGATGINVNSLLALLKAQGIVPEADFGTSTEKAVKAFQSASGLTADGVVGPMTWKALQA